MIGVPSTLWGERKGEGDLKKVTGTFFQNLSEFSRKGGKG